MRHLTHSIAGLLLCICTTSPVMAQLEINIGTKLGLAWPKLAAFGDVRKTFQGQADLFPDYDVTIPRTPGSFNGLEGDIDLFYTFLRCGKFGLTFGYGCFKYKHYRSAWEYTPDPQWTSTDKLRLGLQIIPVTFQYEWPCRFVDNLNWRAGVGADYLKSEFNYNFTQTSPDETFQRGTLSDRGLGWHGGIGAEFDIVPRVRLTFDVKYRSATLDNYRGTLHNELGEGKKARLTMEMVESGYIFGSRYESAPDFTEAKSAKMDFSGFQIGLGITYNLFKTKMKF